MPLRRTSCASKKDKQVVSLGSRGRLLKVFLMAALILGCNAAFAGDWSGWSTMRDHPSVSFRVKCDCSEYSHAPYLWLVEFKNDYNATVSFSFRITAPGERPNGFSDRVEIRSGGTQRGIGTVAVNSNVEVWTVDWKFGTVH